MDDTQQHQPFWQTRTWDPENPMCVACGKVWDIAGREPNWSKYHGANVCTDCALKLMERFCEREGLLELVQDSNKQELLRMLQLNIGLKGQIEALQLAISLSTRYELYGKEFKEREARVTVLESALQQAQATVSFLHSCLTEEGYSYGYPEMTMRRLEEWAKLVPYPRGCGHSIMNKDCPSCVEGTIARRELHEAEKILSTA